ncbi:unnamed protein product [Ophioblennius macclurei]
MANAVASYDQLAHQVEALRQENSSLRRELKDNCQHLSKLESETSGMKEALKQLQSKLEQEAGMLASSGRSDVLHQLKELHMDLTNYYELKHEQHNLQRLVGGGASELTTPTCEEPHHFLDGAPPQISLSGDGRPSELEELYKERELLLGEMDRDERERRWYISQLEVLTQRLAQLPRIETFSLQMDLIRQQLGCEAQQLRAAMERRFSSQQAVHRTQVRAARLEQLEKELQEVRATQESQLQLCGAERPPAGEPENCTSESSEGGNKVEVVFWLLSVLANRDREDMSRTLLALSSSQDSCVAMRRSGCVPLLVQILHETPLTANEPAAAAGGGASREAKSRASAALHNIVYSQADEGQARREMRVLHLLEQIRTYCDSAWDWRDEHRNGNSNADAPEPLDPQLVQTTCALMKLSFEEEYRRAMNELGGLHAVADLIQLDQELYGNQKDPINLSLRRYAGMAVTNLTFGDVVNKATLCSRPASLQALVLQLDSDSEELQQVISSILRNLSWRAHVSSRRLLRDIGCVSALINCALKATKESTLKSVLSALWNLSAHSVENKAALCSVDGALAFLVSTLTYRCQTNSLAIIESGGGILRNVSSLVATREDYRQILRDHSCLQTLLHHLRSHSLTIVSNACGTLWSLSSGCRRDQQLLWELGAVAMLRNLVHSKHKTIAMGSAAALRNLLANCPPRYDKDPAASPLLLSSPGSCAPSLYVRKQKALEAELESRCRRHHRGHRADSLARDYASDSGCFDDEEPMTQISGDAVVEDSLSVSAPLVKLRPVLRDATSTDSGGASDGYENPRRPDRLQLRPECTNPAMARTAFPSETLQKYSVENTPICFSRCSSLSSLSSAGNELDSDSSLEIIEVDDPTLALTTNISETTIKDELASPSGSSENLVHETPLVMSRCSSVSSLDSFGSPSIASSVASDPCSDAMIDGTVSPSDLPDSPGQTAPPSRSRTPAPASEVADWTASLSEIHVPADLDSAVYFTVEKPVENFSCASSLSALPLHEHYVQKDVELKLTPLHAANANSDDDIEILKECINSAMPLRKPGNGDDDARRIRDLRAFSLAASRNARHVVQTQKLLTRSKEVADRVAGQTSLLLPVVSLPEKPRGFQRIKQTLIAGESLSHSLSSSLSSLSDVESDEQPRRSGNNRSHVWFRNRQNKTASLRGYGERSSPSSVSVDSEDDLLQRCITSAMPKQRRRKKLTKPWDDGDDSDESLTDLNSVEWRAIREGADRVVTGLQASKSRDPSSEETESVLSFASASSFTPKDRKFASDKKPNKPLDFAQRKPVANLPVVFRGRTVIYTPKKDDPPSQVPRNPRNPALAQQRSKSLHRLPQDGAFLSLALPPRSSTPPPRAPKSSSSGSSQGSTPSRRSWKTPAPAPSNPPSTGANANKAVKTQKSPVRIPFMNNARQPRPLSPLVTNTKRPASASRFESERGGGFSRQLTFIKEPRASEARVSKASAVFLCSSRCQELKVAVPRQARRTSSESPSRVTAALASAPRRGNSDTFKRHASSPSVDVPSRATSRMSLRSSSSDSSARGGSGSDEHAKRARLKDGATWRRIRDDTKKTVTLAGKLPTVALASRQTSDATVQTEDLAETSTFRQGSPSKAARVTPFNYTPRNANANTVSGIHICDKKKKLES